MSMESIKQIFSNMRHRIVEGIKNAPGSIVEEAKEKLPNMVSEISQQTLEAAPMWDQGWAMRAQGNRMSREIHMVVSKNEALKALGKTQPGEKSKPSKEEPKDIGPDR
jgi:hypothetical protein